MVTINIGSASAELGSLNESWVNEQVDRRRADGTSVCVQVRIKEQDIDMVLTTPQCGSGGGGRQPTPREQRIFELWEKLGLRRAEFAGGQVVAFLKQVTRLL